MTKEQEITRNMKLLGLNREEAEKLYIDDHSDEVLPEVQEMENKAKKMGRRYEKSDKTRKPAQRNIKPDFDKQALVNYLYNSLQSVGGLNVYSVEIKNPQKEITFLMNGQEYSVSLTRHRPKKE